MKRIEIWLLVLAIGALVLKLISVTGADALLGITLSVMAMAYYTFAFFILNSIPFRKVFKRESYQGLSFLRGFGTVVTGFSLSIVIVGVMFKLLLYPGASVMLSVGLISCALVLSFSLYKYLGNFRAKFYKQMLVRMVVFMMFGSVLFFTPGTSLVAFFYKDHPDFVKAYQASTANPDDIELQKKLDEEFHRMREGQ